MVVYTMQISVNENNLITSYAIIGGFENGIEIEDSMVPQGFVINFKPKYYLYNKGKIEVNKNYGEENEVFLPIEQPRPNNSGTDEELRVMFATMQVQLVQANTMVAQVAQQNADLTQKIVNMTNEIERLKGGREDEDAVSEV